MTARTQTRPFLARFEATEGRVDVGTVEFGKALASVLPCAGKPNSDPSTAIVNVHVDGESALVTATNRMEAALADVSLGLGDGPGDTFRFTIGVDVAKEILAGFKADAKADTPEEYAITRIDVTRRQITVTDVSGLLPGKTYKYPRPGEVDTEAGMNLLRLFAEAQATMLPLTETLRMDASGFAAFAKAGQVYKAKARIRPWGHPLPSGEFRTHLLVTIGDQFLGICVNRSPDDGGESEQKADDGWTARFGPLGEETSYEAWVRVFAPDAAGEDLPEVDAEDVHEDPPGNVVPFREPDAD